MLCELGPSKDTANATRGRAGRNLQPATGKRPTSERRCAIEALALAAAAAAAPNRRLQTTNSGKQVVVVDYRRDALCLIFHRRYTDRPKPFKSLTREEDLRCFSQTLLLSSYVFLLLLLLTPLANIAQEHP